MHGCNACKTQCCDPAEMGVDTCLWSALDNYSKNEMTKYVKVIVNESKVQNPFPGFNTDDTSV